MGLLKFLRPTLPKGWIRTCLPGNAGWFDHPEEWEVSDHGQFKVVCSAGGEACFAVSVYARPESSLQQFVSSRFAGEQDIRPITDRYEVKSRHWQGVGQEFRGVIGDDAYETYRCVLCAAKSGAFVSLTLNTTPKRFAEQEALFRRIQTSLRISSPN